MTAHPHFSSCIALNRLRLEVRLGVTEAERLTPQPVDVSLRLYFPVPPEACRTDDADFLCYDKLSQALKDVVMQRSFRLIEFLTMELFDAAKDVAGDDVKLWIRLDKVQAPVDNLLGGASFVFTDLPAGASAVDPV